MADHDGALVLDQPPRPAVPATGEEDGALDLLLAPVDPACHVHLARGGAGSRWVLPTRYDPARRTRSSAPVRP